MTTAPNSVQTDVLERCPFGCKNPLEKPFTYEDWPCWYVQCGNCDARTGDYSTEAEAITAWNTRALTNTKLQSQSVSKG